MGLLFALVAVGWVVENWIAILCTLAFVAAAVGRLRWMPHAVEQLVARQEERRRCAVCSGWSGSVLLTDLDEGGRARLCPQHDAVLHRIEVLERDLVGQRGGASPTSRDEDGWTGFDPVEAHGGVVPAGDPPPR